MMKQLFLFDDSELAPQELEIEKKKRKNTGKRKAQKKGQKGLKGSLFDDLPLFAALDESWQKSGKASTATLAPVEASWSNAFVVERDFFTDTMSPDLSLRLCHLKNEPDTDDSLLSPLQNWGAVDDVPALSPSESALRRLIDEHRALFRLSSCFSLDYIGEISCVFYHDYRGIRKISLVEIKKAQIGFLFYDYREGDPLYMAKVNFSDALRSYGELSLPHEFYGEKGLFYLFDVHRSTIFFTSEVDDLSVYLIDFLPLANP